MKEERETSLNKYNVLLALATLTAIFGLSSPFLVRLYFPNDKLGNLGPIGDWLGGSTAPILGLASFMMVLAAFFIQKEELKAQKEELKLTREEFIEQNMTLSRQRFENTFFHLVSLHHEIVNSIEGRFFDSTVKGRQYFYNAYRRFKRDYNTSTDVSDLKNSYKLVSDSYRKFFEEQQNHFGHYFRNLYHIVKFIDNSPDLTDDEKKNYAGLIRAQLSTYELLLTYYNAISSYGNRKFKPMLDKYSFFHNMDFKLLLDPIHEKLYESLDEIICTND